MLRITDIYQLYFENNGEYRIGIPAATCSVQIKFVITCVGLYLISEFVLMLCLYIIIKIM